jgi:hypothetical protein
MQKKQARDCRWMATREIVDIAYESAELGQNQVSDFGKIFWCSKTYVGPAPT